MGASSNPSQQLYYIARYYKYLPGNMANAWNTYIDTVIAHSKDPQGALHIDQVTIFSLDGGQLWTDHTHPNHFNIKPEESKILAKCMLSKNCEELHINGLHLNGVRYRFVKHEDKTAILGSHCPQGSQQGYANKACAVIAEYLESVN